MDHDTIGQFALPSPPPWVQILQGGDMITLDAREKASPRDERPENDSFQVPGLNGAAAAAVGQSCNLVLKSSHQQALRKTYCDYTLRAGPCPGVASHHGAVSSRYASLSSQT